MVYCALDLSLVSYVEITLANFTGKVVIEIFVVIGYTEGESIMPNGNLNSGSPEYCILDAI